MAIPGDTHFHVTCIEPLVMLSAVQIIHFLSLVIVISMDGSKS